MIEAVDFVAILSRLTNAQFFGVPDSLLAPMIVELERCAAKDKLRLVCAANEGSALSLATGAYLATGMPACVYLQNSGLGNLVNPLTSLAAPQVYGIPALLIVGWRGEMHGQSQRADEPQHVFQGQITQDMLSLLGVPYLELGPETQRETAEAAACQMIDTANRLRTPTALLLRRGTFPASAEAFAKKTAYPNRELAVIEVLKALPNDIPVVGTTGKISREIDAYCATRSQAPTPFLTVGGMGHANMIAGGIALQNPERPVACLDGDGAILMHTGNLATCAQLPNLVHIVFNNRVHDSVGGLPTSAPNLDLAALARVAGYASATCLMSAADIGPAVRSVFGRRGAAFIEIMVSPGARSDLGRPKTSPTENKSKFMAKLGASNV